MTSSTTSPTAAPSTAASTSSLPVGPSRAYECRGSSADVDYPAARVGDRFFKGSGSSQATAVVSGAAALIISQRPGITPDQVKALLMNSAQPLKSASSLCQGAGTLDLAKALQKPTPKAGQNHARPTGTGLLEAARGSAHLIDGEVVLEGEQDILGVRFDSASWAKAASRTASWAGGQWNGSSWSGASWSGASWSGASWSGVSWSGMSWSSASWSSNVWSSKSWGGKFTTMSKSWGVSIS